MLLHDYSSDEGTYGDDELIVGFTIRDLDPVDYPVYIHRSDGMTVVVCDPTATRFEITMALTRPAPAGLTADELDLARVGYGCPPAGMGSCDNDLVSDKPALLFVPEALRLPGERPLQGGAELRRRVKAGTGLEDEHLWLTAERHGSGYAPLAHLAQPESRTA